mmetsp:Transcript_19396/g.31774  ORF Transcript_19396/g.31774 Transcript_19396/m.31774 type:complete len:266 (+) Transcript_19396:160-957(+)
MGDKKKTFRPARLCCPIGIGAIIFLLSVVILFIPRPSMRYVASSSLVWCDADLSLTKSIWTEIDDIVRETHVDDTVSVGISAFPQHVSALYCYVKSSTIRNVCGTGLGSGYFIAMALASNSNSKVIVFDQNRRPYETTVVDLLKRRFPGRLEVIEGDPVYSVKAYLRSHPISCDIVFTSSTLASDWSLIQSFKSAATSHTILAPASSPPSHYYGSHGQGPWPELVRTDVIRPIGCSVNDDPLAINLTGQSVFCIGTFIEKSSSPL